MSDCCGNCAHGSGPCESVKKSFEDGPRPEDFDGFVRAANRSVTWKVRKNFKVVRKVDFQGLDISIEHDKGHTRHWKDRNGEEGTTKMHYPYGYICRTDGADGEQVDVFVGPNKKSDKVFIVHQLVKPDFTKYDEDKVMIGFDSAREAKSAYLMHFDDPRFFGTMTTTDLDAFKRMFVKKSGEAAVNSGPMSMSELQQFAENWRALSKSATLTEDIDLQKGILDQLGKLWGKVKDKFGEGGKKERKVTKTWRREANNHCTTGICATLNGQTIDIDEKFSGINGYQLDGPPAHKNCKCTLDFDFGKSLDAQFMPEETDMTPPAPEGPPMMAPPVMPMMMPDPHDVETFEGVQALLRKMGSVKDPELMEIASKIWGDGYTFEGQPPEVARAEIIGFLLDQRDLLGVEAAMPSLEPSPSLPVKTPSGSSDYSPPSAQAANANPFPEAGSPVEGSPPSSLMDWFKQDSSKKPDELEQSEHIN